MKQITLSLLMVSTALLATPEVSTLSEVFSEAKTSGNIKYYYIQTDKDKSYTNQDNTSAYANSLGGQLRFDTASLYGFSAGATFMTTNPFLLGPNVDTSIIGKDNGARGGNAEIAFSVLGEGYLSYNYQDFGVTLGRKVIKTPLIHAKEVRMLPSAVSGAFAKYNLGSKSKIELAYLDKFKQRTSDTFVDIVQHALGTNTQAITGSSSGSVIMAGVDYRADSWSLKAYDYYSQDFMNSAYIDAAYKMNLKGTKLTFAGQYIKQCSVGNADTNLAKAGSLTAGKSLSTDAFGLKAALSLSSANFTLAYSHLFKDDSKHDSLVLPWDGTPLFTNMITSNDLFQSIYGGAFKADSVYIGGSTGVKIAYSQKFDSLGLEGVKTTLSYLNTSNSKFDKDQNDYNAVVSYKYDKQFSLALKGIWVQNNTGASADGTISQLKLLSQYRVIANYKF